MGGDTIEDSIRKDALELIDRIKLLSSENNRQFNDNESTLDDIISKTINTTNENENDLLARFLHKESSGINYRYSQTSQRPNIDNKKMNNLVTSSLTRRKKYDIKSNNTRVYSRTKKRKDRLRLTSSTIIGILLSIILSIILCFVGIKLILWLVPQVHVVLRYIFEWFIPNVLPKETNLKENLITVSNVTAKVFADDYINKIPVVLRSKTLDESFRKDILNLLEGQYKHTPVTISNIHKIAKERLISSSVSVTTYAATKKLSDIRQNRQSSSKLNINLIVSENVFDNGRMPQILKLVSSNKITLPDCINTTTNICKSQNNLQLFPDDWGKNQIYLSYSTNGTGMNFHHHRQSWHYLVNGRIMLAIFPPSMIANGFDTITDNLKKWMKEVYAKLRQNQRPYIIYQSEGQIVYIPEGFYYATATLSNDSFLISQLASFEEPGGFLNYKIDGLKRYNSGDFQGALKSFKLASDVSYEYSLLYYQALCHEAIFEYKQAEDFYLKTIKKNSRYSPAYEKLLKIYLSSNTSNDGQIRYFEARKLIQNAISKNIVDDNNDLMKLKIDIDNINIQ